jgi:hypothetical protein
VVLLQVGVTQYFQPLHLLAVDAVVRRKPVVATVVLAVALAVQRLVRLWQAREPQIRVLTAVQNLIRVVLVLLAVVVVLEPSDRQRPQAKVGTVE